MKQIYDFDTHEPPRVNESMLREKLERRELRRQILLLYIASLLSCVCFAVFAFFIVRDSLVVSALSILACTVTLIGIGVISVVFHRWGMKDQR